MAAKDFEQHAHKAMVHDHEHWHVTHNWSDTAGTFEHLGSRHSHEHDHAALTHAHVPHVDFDSEHAGEPTCTIMIGRLTPTSAGRNDRCCFDGSAQRYEHTTRRPCDGEDRIVCAHR